MSGYALWNPYTNYLKDNRVWYEKSVYTAIVPNQKKDPIQNPDIWEEEKRLTINAEGQLTLGSGNAEVLDIDTIAQRIFDRIILLVDDKMPIRSVIGKALADLVGVASRVDVVDASLGVVDASLGAFAVIDSALEAKDLIHDISLSVAEAKQLLTDVSLGLVDARLATTELKDAAAESSIAGLDARISAIEISSDTTALSARIDAVDASLALVDASLAVVDVSLGAKVDMEYLGSYQGDVASALAAKVEQSVFDSAIALKADASALSDLSAVVDLKEDMGFMHKLVIEDITTAGISSAYWSETIGALIATAMDAGKIANYIYDSPHPLLVLPDGSPVAGAVRRLRNAHASAVLSVSLGGETYELVAGETATFQHNGSLWRLL